MDIWQIGRQIDGQARRDSQINGIGQTGAAIGLESQRIQRRTDR